MNSPIPFISAGCRVLAAVLLVAALGHPAVGLAAPASTIATNPPSTNDFSTVLSTVMDLLKSHDAARFAQEIVPAPADWKALVSTKADDAAEVESTINATVPHERAQMESIAKYLLARADKLHIDFSNGNWQARVSGEVQYSHARFPMLQNDNEGIVLVPKLEISLVSTGTNAAQRECKLMVSPLMMFPAGWRCSGNIQWLSFPADVMDANSRRDMQLQAALATGRGMNGTNDPALMRLAEVLVHAIQAGDTNLYVRDALLTGDAIWAQMQKAGVVGPTRAQFDEEINRRNAQQAELVRALFDQAATAGLNLKDARIQIKDVSVARMQPLGPPGSNMGMMARDFTVTFAAETDAKAKSGAPLAGEYIFTLDHLLRFDSTWHVENAFRWVKVPAGVFDEKTMANMKLDNYLAEHHSLPPGISAPEIAFTPLNSSEKMKLSDLRGKVVVLDFWATWCGPCQQPMAELQKLKAAHTNWNDRVVVVPLSIDDTIEEVRQHVLRRDWTNTFNVWGGEGGFGCAPARAFHVNGVPSTYIIDPQGVISQAGHPAELRIAEGVDALLEKKK